MVEIVEIGLCGVGSAHIDPRNLRLDNDSERVTKLEREVVMRIMGETQEVRPKFLDDAVVAAIVSLSQRGGLPISVLMHRHATERVRTTVQKESSLRIHPYRTVTDLCLGDVHHPLSLEQLDPDRVEVRIFHAFPKMHAGKDELMVEVIFRERLDKDLAVSLIAQRAIGLQKLDTHKDVRVPIARVDQFSPDIGDNFLLGHDRSLATKPVHSVVLRRKIDIIHDQKPDRIVQSAVLIEVRSDRSHLQVLRVVANHLHPVDTPGQRLCDVCGERRVATLVGRYLLSVDLDNGRLSRTLEKEIICLLHIGDPQITAISRLATVVIRRMAILGVVGMRHAHGLPRGAVLAELPFLKLLLTETTDLGSHREDRKKHRRYHGAKKKPFHRDD